MKIEGYKLILEYDSELIALEDMIEDLPYYLNLKGVKLSAISECQRREMLKNIHMIFNKIKEGKK
jgi:hypothetical protein